MKRSMVSGALLALFLATSALPAASSDLGERQNRLESLKNQLTDQYVILGFHNGRWERRLLYCEQSEQIGESFFYSVRTVSGWLDTEQLDKIYRAYAEGILHPLDPDPCMDIHRIAMGDILVNSTSRSLSISRELVKALHEVEGFPELSK